MNASSSQDLVHIRATPRVQTVGPDLREALHDLIQQSPGIHKSALCRHLGCGWGTVEHHVRSLERSGKITRRTWEGRTVLFPAGLGPLEQEQFAALRMDLGASIVGALASDDAVSLTDVAGRIGRSVRATRRHLTVLWSVGLVERLGAHRPRYRLSHHGLRLRGTHL